MRRALCGAVAVIPALLLSAALPVQAQNAPAGPSNTVCLDPQYIVGTQAVNARTLLFRMKNGEVWRNDLARPCPDLMSTGSGFTHMVHNDRICANTQEFEVNATGMVCRLGQFTRVSGPRSGY
ncbi:MAG TPA: hypothetical protein VEU06_05665 [Micropepsaceae bacterium]|nr:hypothetical protein [Micropepsaceae bacterium]